MQEAEDYRHREGLLNDYFERDMQERDELSALIQAYRRWDVEEGGPANSERMPR